MKKVIFLAAAVFAANVLAQPAEQKAPLAEPQAVKTSDAVKTAAAVEPAAPTPAATEHKSRRMEDARHCLERHGNFEIIKCAEEYL